MFPMGTCIGTYSPQLVVMYGDVMKLSGPGTLLDKVPLWEQALRAYDFILLSVRSIHRGVCSAQLKS